MTEWKTSACILCECNCGIEVQLGGEDDREIVRMRGDKFDPRSVMPAKSPLEAFRRIVQVLLDEAKATPLPDRDSALGNPFASFEELALYERMVLMAEAPLSENDT